MLKRILKYLAILVAAIVSLACGGLALFIFTFEPNDYRKLIEDTVSNTLGRELKISGDLELAPALIPTLAANDVSISNPPWASRPTMATAGRLDVRIALLPLLDGRIEIAHASLERVDVLLERGAQGQGNWQLELTTQPRTAERSQRNIPTRVDEIELREITLRYTEPDGTDIATYIDAVTLAQSPNAHISIQAVGTVQTMPVIAEWQAGPLEEAGTDTDPELRWPVTARISLGDATATMSGRLRAPLAYSRSQFELRISGSNPGQLLELMELPPIDDFAYDLQGRVRIDPDSVQVTNLRGGLTGDAIVGDTRIESGSIALARGNRIEMAIAGTDSGVPFAVSMRLGLLGDMLLGTAPWPLDIEASLAEATVNASGTVAIGGTGTRAEMSLTARGRVLESLNRLRPFGLPQPGPVSLDATLIAEPDQVALRDVYLSVADSNIEGNLALTGLPGSPTFAGDLVATSIDLGAFPAPAPEATDVLDRPLSLEWLELIDGSLNFTLAELRGLPFTLTDARLSASLNDSVIEVPEFAVRIAALELRGRGTLEHNAGSTSLEVDVEAQPGDSETLMRALNIAEPAGLTWSAGPAALHLSTRGASLREAANASRIEIQARPVSIGFTNDSASAAVDAAVVRISTEPGSSVRLEATGSLTAEAPDVAIDEPFELSLTGGSLAELLSTRRLWPEIAVTIDMAYAEQPLHLQASVADTAALIRRDSTPLLLDAQWGPWTAHIDAALVATPSLSGTTADIRVSTDALGPATALLGFDGLPAGAGSVSGNISIAENELATTELVASIPGIDVRGALSLARSDRIDGRADLLFSSLDLTPYLATNEPPPDAGESAGQLALHDLYTDDPLELVRLRSADLDLSAAIDRFRFGAFVSQDVALELALARGELRLETRLDAGRINATAEIDAREDDVGLRVSMSGDDVPLAVDQTAERAANTPVMDVDVTLAGRGASSRALTESLNGTMEIYLTRGRMRSAGFRFLFGSVVYQLLDTINPFTERQEFVDIECVGAFFDVVDGVLSTRNGIIMQTPDVQVVGVGTAGLGDGSLQMQFRTKRRTGVVISIGGIVNEFVELTGTLDAPRVQVSARRASRSGLIALATGGLSLLATDIFGRLTAGDVCEDLPVRVSAPATAND